MISILVSCAIFALSEACQTPSITEVDGTFAQAIIKGTICPGDIIFEENFDTFDLRKWQHEITLTGGGNWEFEYYNNNRSNSFVEDGYLHIRPTFLADEIGEEALYSATLDINGGAPADMCTNPTSYGCLRTGTAENILNPIKSARIRTLDSFSFKYGRVEVNAKLPAGDWLWPAIWMLPSYNQYGGWPASGEIDIAESRGNENLVQNGVNIGTKQVVSTLHWGPNYYNNRYSMTQFMRNLEEGYDKAFHKYQVEWTPEMITFSVDDVVLGTVSPANGFWEYGGFSQCTLNNPWKMGSKLAPFDQHMHIILNLAVGGTNGFFPDDASNPSGKPWKNDSPTAYTDFWKGKTNWDATWNTNDYSSDFIIDYVKVWAV